MDTKPWNIGAPCFITSITIHPAFVHMSVLPAIVCHIGGTDGRSVTAEAYLDQIAGPDREEGSPFLNEEAAREWIAEYVERIVAASKNVALEGYRPERELSAELPKNGDIVYTIDRDTKEILQVTVGIVTMERGFLEIGYDPSPQNCETSMVRMERCWKAQEDALAYACQNFGTGFIFVPKEEVEKRANQGIEEIWRRATEFHKSPAGRRNLAALARMARQKLKSTSVE